MRFIAVIGVLFVLASCSDSDTPENFALSCDNTKFQTSTDFFQFDFDKNIVINEGLDAYGVPTFYEYSITEVTPLKIAFDNSQDVEYVLDRANLTMVKTSFYMNRTSTLTNYYKCKLPQV